MSSSVPPPFRVLLPRAQIRVRIRELARQIRLDFGDEPPVLVAVIEGARTFARRLLEDLPAGLQVQEIRAASYGAGTASRGRVRITGGPDPDPAGRSVLLLEDIVDTGRTVAALQRRFTAAGARDCRVATLLSKAVRRVVEVPLHYVGFEIPDEFVVGFGMDHAGRYRELADVVIYDADVEQAAGH